MGDVFDLTKLIELAKMKRDNPTEYDETITSVCGVLKDLTGGMVQACQPAAAQAKPAEAAEESSEKAGGQE